MSVGCGGCDDNGAALLSLSYCGRPKAEADRGSVDLMRKAGMDSGGARPFLRLLEERLGDKSGTNMLSPTPAPRPRKAIEEMAREK